MLPEFSTIRFQPTFTLTLRSKLSSPTCFDSQLPTTYSLIKLLGVLKSWLKWRAVCHHQNMQFSFWIFLILPLKHYKYTIKKKYWEPSLWDYSQRENGLHIAFCQIISNLWKLFDTFSILSSHFKWLCSRLWKIKYIALLLPHCLIFFSDNKKKKVMSGFR